MYLKDFVDWIILGDPFFSRKKKIMNWIIIYMNIFCGSSRLRYSTLYVESSRHKQSSKKIIWSFILFESEYPL